MEERKNSGRDKKLEYVYMKFKKNMIHKLCVYVCVGCVFASVCKKK